MPARAVRRLLQAIVTMNWCKGYAAGLFIGLSWKEVSTILRGGLISHYPKGSAKGEGHLLLTTDGKVRRLGHRYRLDT